jgi:hypothetical protein
VLGVVANTPAASLSLLDETATSVLIPDEDTKHFAGSKFNFASNIAGAVIIDKAPASAQGFTNLLNEDRDKYAIWQCSEPKQHVIIGLSEEVSVTSVVIANHEKYSSSVKEFLLLGSAVFPPKEWINLGTYETLPKLGAQEFNITTAGVGRPPIMRYIRFKFLSHHGSQNLCTLSQIKVHGLTAIVSLHAEVVEHDDTFKTVLTQLAEDLLSKPLLDAANDAANESEKLIDSALKSIGNVTLVGNTTEAPNDSITDIVEEKVFTEEQETDKDGKPIPVMLLEVATDVILKPLISIIDSVDTLNAPTAAIEAAASIVHALTGEDKSADETNATSSDIQSPAEVTDDNDTVSSSRAIGNTTVESGSSDSSGVASEQSLKMIRDAAETDAGYTDVSEETGSSEVPDGIQVGPTGTGEVEVRVAVGAADELRTTRSTIPELPTTGHSDASGVVCTDMCDCANISKETSAECMNICSNKDSTPAAQCVLADRIPVKEATEECANVAIETISSGVSADETVDVQLPPESAEDASSTVNTSNATPESPSSAAQTQSSDESATGTADGLKEDSVGAEVAPGKEISAVSVSASLPLARSGAENSTSNDQVANAKENTLPDARPATPSNASDSLNTTIEVDESAPVLANASQPAASVSASGNGSNSTVNGTTVPNVGSNGSNGSNGGSLERYVQYSQLLANSCLDNVKFVDFKAKMEAKLSGLYSTGSAAAGASGSSGDSFPNSQENVFRLLMQKIKMLEMNHAIIEMYTGSVNECYRAIITDLVMNNTLLSSEIQNFGRVFQDMMTRRQHMSDELFDVLVQTVTAVGSGDDAIKIRENVSIMKASGEQRLRDRLSNVWGDFMARMNGLETMYEQSLIADPLKPGGNKFIASDDKHISKRKHYEGDSLLAGTVLIFRYEVSQQQIHTAYSTLHILVLPLAFDTGHLLGNSCSTLPWIICLERNCIVPQASTDT